MSEQDTVTQEVTTADEWGAKGVHTVTCPSGAVVKVRIPNLAALAKTGELPNSLLAVAVPGSVKEEAVTTEDEANERIGRLADFERWLLSKAMVSPAVTEEDVAAGKVPSEDGDMLVEIATRGRDLDAIGNHIAGLEKSADWRRFRKFQSSDEAVLDE